MLPVPAWGVAYLGVEVVSEQLRLLPCSTVPSLPLLRERLRVSGQAVAQEWSLGWGEGHSAVNYCVWSPARPPREGVD